MSLSYIASAVATGEDVSSIDCTTSLNLQAGDLVVAWVKYENTDTPLLSVQATTGAPNALTLSPRAWSGTSASVSTDGYWAWLLSATANATATFRATYATTVAGPRMVVKQFRPDAGETVSLSPASANPVLGTGNGSGPDSGNIDGAGTDGVQLGGYSEYNVQAWNPNDPKIGTNDCSATVVSVGGSTYAWHLLYTSDPPAQNAHGTTDNSDYWVCGIIGFQSVAGGGTTPLTAQLSESLIYG